MKLWQPSIEQRQRSRQFDRIAGSINDAVSDPSLLARLGCYAIPLAVATDRLFLPNVRHGNVVSVPKGIHPDGFALLPLIGNKVIRLHSSMLEQTASRKETNGLRVGKINIRPVVNVATVNKARTHAKTGKPGPYEAYVSRPILLAGPAITSNEHLTAAVPAAMVHEIQHGNDMNAVSLATEIKTDHFMASTELAAYHVGQVVFDHLSCTQVVSEDDREFMINSCAVESARLELCDPSQPFEPTDAMIDFLRDNHYI